MALALSFIVHYDQHIRRLIVHRLTSSHSATFLCCKRNEKRSLLVARARVRERGKDARDRSFVTPPARMLSAASSAARCSATRGAAMSTRSCVPTLARRRTVAHPLLTPTAAPVPIVRRRHAAGRCAASSGDNKSNNDLGDNDVLYMAKLALLSFAGAALIKYGSELVALPHEPNVGVALLAAVGTPVAYGAWLLVRP